MPDIEKRALEVVLSSQKLEHVLYESARSARVLLKVNASIIFLLSGNQLAAAAWHGREASELTVSVNSPYIKALWASRRSITWDGRDRCTDPEIGAVLDVMRLESGLIIPVMMNGVYFGFWLAASASERSFSDNDEQILMTFAENIALTTESILLSADNMRLQREANALFEIGKEISHLMDLDRVLEVIAKKTCSLMGAEISYIALADDERQEVRVRITEGTHNDLLGKMVLKYGEGVGGYVAASHTPQLVDSYPKDPRPKPPGVMEMAASEDIQSIISVPMVTRNGLIGVLFAASRQEGVFNHSQMDLLSALGTQAAIAIENARLYDLEKITTEKIRFSTQTARQLLDLVLGNQGLQAITDTLSKLIACPVAVEDNLHRTLSISFRGQNEVADNKASLHGFSSSDLWTDPELTETLRALRETRQSIRVPPRPQRRAPFARVIVPIVAGDNLLGNVIAFENEKELTDQQRSAVEQASIVIALEFLMKESAQAVEQRLAGDFLDDIINGRGVGDPAVYQRAARLNVDLHRAHRIMVLDIDKFAQEVARYHWTDIDALAVKRRFNNTVAEIVHRKGNGGLVGTQSDSVMLLLPVDDETDITTLVEFARTIQESLRSVLPDLSISIGIGQAFHDPTHLPRSYQEAILALRTASCSEKRGCVVAYEELGVMPLLLQSQDQAGLTNFMQRNLGLLLAYDKKNETELVETLRHYLNNNGNLQRTAAACHVHINSLKYRLQRIEEIGKIDLHDGQTRFSLQLALSIQSALNLLHSEVK